MMDVRRLSRRLSRRFPVVLPFIVLAASAQMAEARPFWTVPVLSAFNGSTWGELQIGRTTFRQIRDKWETGKGAYERSTELAQPKNSQVRVDLLWTKAGDKAGDDEILRAITVRFNHGAPQIGDVARLFTTGDQPIETFFLRGRFEDWTALRFASRGFAAMTLAEGDIISAPLLVLTTPSALSTMSRHLDSQFTPVERRIDPHEADPKVMEFDIIDVDIDLSDDLDLPHGEKRRTVEQIEDAVAGGTIRNRTRGDGSYKVSVTGNNRKNKGGSIYASVTISGSGPYGPITATGSGNDTWNWTEKERKNDKYKDRYALDAKVRDAYRDAVNEARTSAENSFARQMRDSGPPPLWAIREAQWADIVNDIRYFVKPADAPVSILR